MYVLLSSTMIINNPNLLAQYCMVRLSSIPKDFLKLLYSTFDELLVNLVYRLKVVSRVNV